MQLHLGRILESMDWELNRRGLSPWMVHTIILRLPTEVELLHELNGLLHLYRRATMS
jgi:hypothetical protein